MGGGGHALGDWKLRLAWPTGGRCRVPEPHRRKKKKSMVNEWSHSQTLPWKGLAANAESGKVLAQDEDGLLWVEGLPLTMVKSVNHMIRV